MTSSILNVGKSALAAAQAGLVTTGHNIANVNTPGYSRQTVIQGPAMAQDFGGGFLQKGADIVTVRRAFDDFLTGQVRTAQSNAKSMETYFQQISQIDNLLADPTAGLSPAIQDFFAGVQNVAANPSDRPARQTLLSSAEALAARFQSMDSRLTEIRDGINTAITSKVDSLNSYAQQIARLNDQIEKAQSAVGDASPPNDLLDQRDQVISDLSSIVKVSVVKQVNSYNVFIGNGQPLTVGTQTYTLAATTSPTDVSRATIGVVAEGTVNLLPDSVLTGGSLGGLFDFRSEILDPAQNSLGRIAMGFSYAFNQQHQLGMDLNGAIGGAFFNPAVPVVSASVNNSATNPEVSASIADVSYLTTSDYRLRYDGSNYMITRLSDSAVLYNNPAFPPSTTTIDGFSLSLTSGSFSVGDEFVIKPTVGGAADFDVAINDVDGMAMAAPIKTSSPLSNTGSGQISAGVVNGPPPVNANLLNPVTITFTAANQITITDNATSTTTGPLAYTIGSDLSFNGWSVKISGAPAVGDTFNVTSNSNGVADGRNAVLLGGLQTTKTLAKNSSGSNTLSFQSAYGQLVNLVGSKSYEVRISSAASEKLLTHAKESQQAQSGVNLDEEATNLLRYQQAYQAAGKVMQTASQLFDLLFDLGR